MKCATCYKETDQLKRVVIDSEYNKALAKAVYNCPSCYEKKLKARLKEGKKK